MSDYQRIKQAIAYLLQHQNEQPSLTQLATHMALSEAHLQRIFTRWAGVSPKRFLQYVTMEQLKQHLQSGESILETSHQLGLSSASRVYDLSVTIHGVTPGELKSKGLGLELHYGWGETPFGLAFVAQTQRGICQLSFCDREDPVIVDALQQLWPRALLQHQPESCKALLTTVFSRSCKASQLLSLWLKGSNFQLQVWQALLALPYGQKCSYQQLAASIGKPQAYRAVANAVGRNAIAYLIPCHRVIRSSGALGGYRWGLERKQLMLGRESSLPR